MTAAYAAEPRLSKRRGPQQIASPQQFVGVALVPLQLDVSDISGAVAGVMAPCGRSGRGTAANGLVLGDHAPSPSIKLEQH